MSDGIDIPGVYRQLADDLDRAERLSREIGQVVWNLLRIDRDLDNDQREQLLMLLDWANGCAAELDLGGQIIAKARSQS